MIFKIKVRNCKFCAVQYIALQHNLLNSACQRFFQGFFKNIFRKYPIRDIFVFSYPCKPGTFPNGKVLLEIGLKRYYFPERERKMTARQIGKLIRDTRKIQGLRQDELAAAAGVGRRFLVELEAGKETAQLGKTLSVLSALGCAIDIKPPDAGGQ